MSFPRTHLTLIQRLASGGGEEDWQRFLGDYWGPVSRFSLRHGAQNLDDAEDVASQTFEVLWENRLLVRWLSRRSAKLRTLLCSVSRKILANRHRVQATRQRLAREIADHLKELEEPRHEPIDAFYEAWVEDVVQQAVESLATEYFAQGKGDYVRVVYGRLCRRMTIAQVAEALEIAPATVDNYYRHARDRLASKLQEGVRRQIVRYCPGDEVADEFRREWQQMGDYLAEHGGLEDAVRRAYDLLDPVAVKRHKGMGLTRAVTRLTSIIRREDGDDARR